jgi:UPF0755 protein
MSMSSNEEESKPESGAPAAPNNAAASRLWKAFGLFLVLLALLPCLYMVHVAYITGPLAANKTVVVSKGTPVYDIGFLLEENGIVSNAFVFRVAVHLLASGNIKAGEYAFTAGETMAEVIAMMRDGAVVVHKFAVPEGLTSNEIVDLLRSERALTGSIDDVPDEGSLMPATYNFTYGDERGALIDTMKRKRRELLADLWAKRDPNLPLQSPEEALVMASIVEKETGKKAEERPRVAGVFYNRLKSGMRLQSDPTVIYAITNGEGPMLHPLTRADLDTISPYNTYLNAGLPPKPICNPGKAAIRAALHPEANDYIYFVADGTGGHVFAHDLASHNRNVAQWNRINRQP